MTRLDFIGAVLGAAITVGAVWASRTAATIHSLRERVARLERGDEDRR